MGKKAEKKKARKPYARVLDLVAYFNYFLRLAYEETGESIPEDTILLDSEEENQVPWME